MVFFVCRVGSLYGCVLPVYALVTLCLCRGDALTGVTVASMFCNRRRMVSSAVVLVLFMLVDVDAFFVEKVVMVSRRKEELGGSLITFLVCMCVLSMSISLFMPFRSEVLCFTVKLPLLSFVMIREFLEIRESVGVLRKVMLLFFLLDCRCLVGCGVIRTMTSSADSGGSSCFLLCLLPFLLYVRGGCLG